MTEVPLPLSVVGETPEGDFASLSRQLRPALLRFFRRRTRSAADAEELVQELFVRLMRRTDLMSLENVEAYAYEAAANLLRDRFRRETSRARGRHVDVASLDLASDHPSPESIVDSRQRLRRLLQKLDELPQRAQTIFMLRRFEGLTYPQIAERLEISISAVEKHMTRVMQALTAEK